MLRKSLIIRIIVSIFLVLTFFYSPAMSTTAMDWFNHAKALWDEEGGKFTDPQKAIGYLNNVVKSQPNYAPAYNSRGNAYADLGNYQQAIKDYNEAIRLKPDYVSAYINRGDAYFGLSQYKRAIEDCNKAIHMKPYNSVAYSNRGKAYAKLGQYQHAIEDFNEAIRLHPNNINAYNNRGLTYLLQGNNDLGCLDAQETCSRGFCKVLEWAKRKGYCRQEQPPKPKEDKIKLSLPNFSITRTPGKQFQTSIGNAASSDSIEQPYVGIKGIFLTNGNKIEGQIISINANTVKIRTKDGIVSSYSFVEEVMGFIPE
ncbi:MAG: tetratricopeptide repeat protein [Syntrophaceae bacterium]|nr:tetratricopeptide repeat protein [Syntrophaceae bacterium]